MNNIVKYNGSNNGSNNGSTNKSGAASCTRARPSQKPTSGRALGEERSDLFVPTPERPLIDIEPHVMDKSIPSSKFVNKRFQKKIKVAPLQPTIYVPPKPAPAAQERE